MELGDSMGIMVRGYDQNSQSKDINVRTMTTEEVAFFNYPHGRYMATPGTLSDGDDTFFTFDNARRLKVAATVTGPINLTTGDITVDAFILSDNTTHGDATAFVDGESLAGKTVTWVGSTGYDKTGDKAYAIPINVNDAAYNSTNLNIPVGGKYIASLPTYTDGDSVPFTFTVDGKLLTNAEVTLNDYTDNSNEFTASSSKGLNIMGIYQSTPTTITDGNIASISIDNKRNLKVTASADIPTTITNDVKTVTLAGTAEALGTTLATKSIYIRASSTNTGYIYVGGSGVTSANGIILSANDSITLEISDRATVYINSSVNGEGVGYCALS